MQNTFPVHARHLHWQVLIAVAMGIVAGHFWPALSTVCQPLSIAFIKAIRMLLAPLVFFHIVTGIGSIGQQRNLGSLLLKSLALFYLMTLLALISGWLTGTLTHPGANWHFQPSAHDADMIAGLSTPTGQRSFTAFALHLIPSGFVSAFTGHDLLPVLLLAVLTGVATARTQPDTAALLPLMEACSQCFFRIFAFLTRFAPLAAFAAISFTVATQGWQIIGRFAYLILSFYLACGIFTVIVAGGLARLYGLRLMAVLRYFRDEWLIIIGTSSSEPVLPALLEKLQKLGCKKEVAGLVLPMAYSFNLDGTAIYLTLASMFIAQACDITLSTGQILSLIGIMLVTSKGTAGVSGSGLVTLIATLSIVPDLPLPAVALLVGIDRFMSEARALTSTISNVVLCLVLSMHENACDRDMLARELQPFS
ncbi:cation:dicarboxylate symporter family transporter [Undibacterium luofuense]|uniref:cation:dicarboxylate symporter family transporter n=1 Tax=Undibacterium luofuense TaxID=2828733 RepID=UPI0030EDBF65